MTPEQAPPNTGRPFLRRGPSGPLAVSGPREIAQIGYDQPTEEFIIPPASPAKFPRNAAGDPLKVVLAGVTPGNFLEVDWRANLQADRDGSYYQGAFSFVAIAVATFDGTEPSAAPSATTFLIRDSYGSSEFQVGSDIQSMSGLAGFPVPDGATTATVELLYFSLGDVIVGGAGPNTLQIPGLSATLKVTELAGGVDGIVTQAGPGNVVPNT